MMLKKILLIVIITISAISITGCGMAPLKKSELYGTAGVVLGSQLKNAPVVGAVILGLTGYIFGDYADKTEEAIGTTTCEYNAHKTGSDKNGRYNQTAESSKTIPGYGEDCGK